MWEDQYDEDVIVLCDGCNVATHQSCYGRELIKMDNKGKTWLDENPDEGWWCKRCLTLKENQDKITPHGLQDNMDETAIKCFICKEFKGLLGQFYLKDFGLNAQSWAHYTCVNYIPEIHFIDDFKE